MKKWIPGITMLLSLLLTGCSGNVPVAASESFEAVILEVNGDSVLVEPLEGEDERRSSDKISPRAIWTTSARREIPSASPMAAKSWSPICLILRHMDSDTLMSSPD